MGDKGGGGKGIKIEPAKDYEKMIKLQLKYLPKQLQAEYANRAMWDPKLIEQALGLQHAYDPALAREQYSALERRDPQWLDVHEAFGDKVKEAVSRGYVDPTRAKLYEETGELATGDILRRGTMSPEVARQTAQNILRYHPNLSYGEAQDMVLASGMGLAGERLKQQRQQAANQFLGQQSESDLALTAGGRYMGTPGIVQMENMIGGVQAPRAFGYVNPQAGMQGVQLGLQNQQANLANQALQGGSGSSNPWMNALQGAGTGMSMGSVGGPYGAAGGAIVGAAAGAFGYPQYSDERLKTNPSRTGLKTRDGIPIMDYDMDGRRWRGVMAQDVLSVRPDAVVTLSGGRLGVFYDKLGIKVREVF